MGPMQLRIFTEPQQGAAYETLLRVAKASEDLGFDAFFRSDHYLKFGDVSGLPGPTDAWTTLAGLARETSRIRLGTLVSASTFRYPGPLAITVAQVDLMSARPAEPAMGGGGDGAEHPPFRLSFPHPAYRSSRYEHARAIITRVWDVPGCGTVS